MLEYKAENVDHLELGDGEIFMLESLRQAVVPPYILIVPFIELPSGIELVRQDGLEEDGIHGANFMLRAAEAGEGELRVGFRDLRNGDVVIEKSIHARVS